MLRPPASLMSMAGRVLFPASGFTTEDLVYAYEKMAPVLLPHLAQRPLTLKRLPDDIHGEIFWEKDAPQFHSTIRQALARTAEEWRQRHQLHESSRCEEPQVGCFSRLHRDPLFLRPYPVCVRAHSSSNDGGAGACVSMQV
jgi:hypothetical protein